MERDGPPTGVGAGINVRNAVVSATLDHNVDPDGIVSLLDHARYGARMFPCAVVGPPDAGAPVPVFAFSKMACAGAKSVGEARRAIRVVHTTLEDTGLMRCGAGVRVQFPARPCDRSITRAACRTSGARRPPIRGPPYVRGRGAGRLSCRIQ